MKRTPLDKAIGVPAGSGTVFLDMMGGMSAGQAIENQERQGQQDACRMQALPINGTFELQDIWEKLGFVFGERVDDLFVNVTMPEGWELRPTEHSMWSNLHDAQGRIRAKMFYKAAFYDRDARISLCRRFTLNQYDVKEGDPRCLVRVSVYDATKVDQGAIRVIEREAKELRESYDLRESLADDAHAWLNDAYPDWKDYLAYW